MGQYGRPNLALAGLLVTGGLCSYMVTHLMGADLNNIVKTQRLSDDHVQFLVYQILRGLKACIPHTPTWSHM